MYRREKMWQRQKTGLKDFLAENTMMNAAIEQMDGVVSWTAFPGDAGLEAEQLLLDLGFHQLRVRIHGTLARIEVLPDELQKVLENRNRIVKAFKEYGFTYVTMDLQGYRMGSMNEIIEEIDFRLMNYRLYYCC